jgi:hypothetical protein
MAECEFPIGFKCSYLMDSGMAICTLTGGQCLVDRDGGGHWCLRARWADEFEAKHGTSVFELGERLARQTESAPSDASP